MREKLSRGFFLVRFFPDFPNVHPAAAVTKGLVVCVVSAAVTVAVTGGEVTVV